MAKPGVAGARVVGALLLLAGALPASAARPLATEDAAVVGDKACQLEAWLDRGREATAAWLVPACNFGLGIEWQVGFMRERIEGRSAFSEAYAQAKYAYAVEAPSPWSIGLVLGVTRKQRETRRGWQNPYVIVPFTVTPGGGNTALHLNVGYSHDRIENPDVTLWGVGVETALTERFALLGEVFGENAERPFVRVGGRYSVVPDHLDIDLTVVMRPGGPRAEHYISLGLAWQLGSLLP
jgi:hypothetical protein